LEYYRRALEIFRQIGDPVHEGFILNSIGVTLSELGRNDDAIRELEQAAVLNHENREYLLEGHSHAALGDLWFKKGDFSKSLECYEKSLAIRRQIGDKKGEAWMLYRQGLTHCELKEIPRAKEAARLSMQLASEVGDESLKNSSKQLLQRLEGGVNA
jgi:tetratricopeptide (TPR) repeat protein